jgi:hypothetical protein
MPPANLLETLQGNIPALLPEAVRLDQRSPAFEITSWIVERLSHKGIINPDGIFQFSGRGRDKQNERSWKIILKVFDEPDESIGIAHLWNGKRELYAMQSNLLPTSAFDSFTAPRCYGTEERDGCAWIWMEYIDAGHNSPWTDEQYTSAARYLGRFNGVSLTQKPLPDFPWLCRSVAQGWCESFPPVDIWDNPEVVGAINDLLRERVLALWDERTRFYNILDRLPQVFSHGDAQRRNLFFRQRADGTDELVAVDWAQCGIGALGGDLFFLVGASALLFEIAPADLPRIEAAAFDGYLSGLRDIGWNGTPELIRLSYCAWSAMMMGTVIPPAIVGWTTHNRAAIQQLFGKTPDQFVVDLAMLCAYAHDRADEARQLMARLM